MHIQRSYLYPCKQIINKNPWYTIEMKGSHTNSQSNFLGLWAGINPLSTRCMVMKTNKKYKQLYRMKTILRILCLGTRASMPQPKLNWNSLVFFSLTLTYLDFVKIQKLLSRCQDIITLLCKFLSWAHILTVI